MNFFLRYFLAVGLLFVSALCWADKILIPDYENAPRPNFMPSEILNLDKTPWKFSVGDDRGQDSRTLKNSSYPHVINFGFAPEAENSGLDYERLRSHQSSSDIIWYQKEIILPLDWEGAILTFEGVDYDASVFFNGQFVMAHKGAFAPFEADITPYLSKGKKVPTGIQHVITLRAQDDRTARDRAVGKQERRPYEGVIFYGNSSGAWKGAHLRKINPLSYFSKFKVRTNSKGLLQYQLEVKGTLKSNYETVVQVLDRDRKVVVAKSTSNVFGGHKVVNELVVNSPKLWTPDQPVLYDVHLELKYQGTVVEKMRSYVGFSDFVQKNGHFLLNGEPFYLRGVLNQMVYPKGLYTPDENDNALDLKMIRMHGFNFHRVHQTTPRWRDIYEMENGILVQDKKTKKVKRLGVAWALEMPSARDLRDAKAQAQFSTEWKEIIEAYGHGHPGLLYYVPLNEDWGMLEDPDHWSPASDSEREDLQHSMLRTTLSNAPPGSLVSPGDGWRQITGLKSRKSLTSFNPYQLILSAHDYRGSAKELMAAYSNLPVNAPVGSVFPANGKELILNGYIFPGKYVAPVMGEFGGKSYAPPGIGNVFGYGHVYRDIDLWTKDALAQFSAMGSLPIMRGGYVYTQVRDAGFKPHLPLPPDRPAGELNGFLSADGVPKSNPDLWLEINLLNQSAHDKNRALYEKLEGPVQL